MATQRWLPETALHDGRLATQISAIMQPWAVHWFGAAGEGVYMQAVSELDEEPVRTIGMRVERALGQALMGLPGSHYFARDGDRVLCDELAEAARQDLETRLRATAGSDASGDPGQPAFGFEIHQDGIGHLVTFWITKSAAIDLRIAAIKGTSTKVAALGPRKRSISDKSVSVRPELGHVAIELSELKALEVGDVLLLDAAPDQVETLIVDGEPRALAPVTLSIDEAGLRLAGR